MKLIRLKVTDPDGFRSFQSGFEIHFRNERNLFSLDEFNPFVLAGPNGSGKSNLLELLASIFFHLECMYLNYRPESFEYDEENNSKGFQGLKCSPDAFELEYCIPLSKSFNQFGNTQFGTSQFESDSNQRDNKLFIRIIKKNNESPRISKHYGNIEKAELILDRQEIKSILPQYILGYSSGENEIISLPFYKMRFIHFDEYREISSKNGHYGQNPEGRLIYLDEHLNQSILLANFLMQDKKDLKIFEKVFDLTEIRQFSLIIGKHYREDFHEEILRNNPEDTSIQLTSKLYETINKLESCATAYLDYYGDETEKDSLRLDFFVNEETKKAFRLQFGNDPLQLFQAFQILFTLNYARISKSNREKIYSTENIYLKQDLTNISMDDDSIFRIKDLKLQKGDLDCDIYTRSLSDGEYQLLHSIGLCMLYRNTNSLFLLDEPETHFNPEWRARFVTILKECFENSDNSQEMLITTHTPYLISDSKRESVLVFKNENRKVEVKRPEFNTFGASVNKITMMTFGKKATIGGYSESILDDLNRRYDAGESPEKLIEEANIKLGDSVEKVLLVNRLLDKGEKK